LKPRYHVCICIYEIFVMRTFACLPLLCLLYDRWHVYSIFAFFEFAGQNRLFICFIHKLYWREQHCLGSLLPTLMRTAYLVATEKFRFLSVFCIFDVIRTKLSVSIGFGKRFDNESLNWESGIRDDTIYFTR